MPDCISAVPRLLYVMPEVGSMRSAARYLRGLCQWQGTVLDDDPRTCAYTPLGCLEGLAQVVHEDAPEGRRHLPTTRRTMSGSHERVP